MILKTASRAQPSPIAPFQAASPRPRGQRSFWQDVRSTLVRKPSVIVSAGIIIMFLVAAIVGTALTPYDYTEQNLLAVEQSPSRAHWFGTDEVGRDFFSRIVAGARTAFLVATMVTLVGGTLGVILGAVAGLSTRWPGNLILRLIDILMSFPTVLLAIFVNATIRPAVQNWTNTLYQAVPLELFKSRLLSDYLVVFGALALVSWPGLARLVRGQVLTLRQTEFVEAAIASGATQRWIVVYHLLPNLIGPVLISLTVSFGGAMMLESSLSYLGVGIQPPQASWGAMINENLDAWRYTPRLILVPGATLALVIFAFNFLGEGLNDALNPRQRRR